MFILQWNTQVVSSHVNRRSLKTFPVKVHNQNRYCGRSDYQRSQNNSFHQGLAFGFDVKTLVLAMLLMTNKYLECV